MTSEILHCVFFLPRLIFSAIWLNVIYFNNFLTDARGFPYRNGNEKSKWGIPSMSSKSRFSQRVVGGRCSPTSWCNEYGYRPVLHAVEPGASIWDPVICNVTQTGRYIFAAFSATNSSTEKNIAFKIDFWISDDFVESEFKLIGIMLKAIWGRWVNEVIKIVLKVIITITN